MPAAAAAALLSSSRAAAAAARTPLPTRQQLRRRSTAAGIIIRSAARNSTAILIRQRQTLSSAASSCAAAAAAAEGPHPVRCPAATAAALVAPPRTRRIPQQPQQRHSSYYYCGNNNNGLVQKTTKTAATRSFSSAYYYGSSAPSVSSFSRRMTTTAIRRTTTPSLSPALLCNYFSSQASSSADDPQPADELSQQQQPQSNADNADNEPVVRGLVVSREDERREETKRKRLSEVLISEVLQAKHAYRWVDPVIDQDATVKDAITCTVEGGLSGMMVLASDGNRRAVMGILTSRDLLRILAAGIRQGNVSDEELLARRVGDFMTPISQVIYGRPDETVGMCRTIMAKLGIKCLPILTKQGTVEGLITARDMSDFGLTAKDKGGKQSFLKDVSQRVGLTAANTSMADPPQFMQAHLALEQTPLFVNTAVAALPHPFKTANGVAGRSRREIQQPEYSSDPDLSEDSHFTQEISLPDETDPALLRRYTYLGVADGVGSWREYGVDVREFSRRLMRECSNLLLESCHEGGRRRSSNSVVLAPAQLMAQAYERVKHDNVIGSCTACVALFDGHRHQLHFSNLGDSGLIVLRHIDSDVAGALRRDKTKPRQERTSDLRLAFVSQQQLRSFNHPYQLGWTGEELPAGEESSFKEARDSCTSSIHVRRGDIVIVATDGLFDNVDADEICQICIEWEEKCGFLRGGDIVARERRWSMGNSLSHVSAESIGDLATTLTERARANSLNSELDSPFAILAKENDIMWSGGMPDDCTCIAIHVTGVAADDIMDHTNM